VPANGRTMSSYNRWHNTVQEDCIQSGNGRGGWENTVPIADTVKSVSLGAECKPHFLEIKLAFSE
jgi:hypothetical protein